MPLITVTVRKGTSVDIKGAILHAVHAALISIGVPATDKFQRVLELSEDDFRYDPTYPDAGSPRGKDFALVEILWSVGRSVKIKKQFLTEMMRLLREVSINPEHVMVVFKETQWENWSFAGGRLIHT
jgi:phenylpyruvate tautomerase PptA (4-oxalocrotonate tautomerase family)